MSRSAIGVRDRLAASRAAWEEKLDRAATDRERLEVKQAIVREYRELRPLLLRDRGFRPVPVNGSTEIGDRLGYLSIQLRDGTRGYAMRRFDDCLQAAVATLLQVPMHAVPDARIDQQLRAGRDPDDLAAQMWLDLAQFAKAAGRFVRHQPPPFDAPRWIAIAPGANAHGFEDHSLVMQRSEVLFDPFGDTDLRAPTAITVGITVE